MLPAWAAVAIALGGAAIGAAGALVGAYVALRTAQMTHAHEMREAWRAKMLEAAEDFVTASNALAWSVRTRLMDVAEGRAVVDMHTVEERWGELRRAGIRVSLIFGVHSAPAEKAWQLIDVLRAGVAALAVAESPDTDEGDADAQEAVWRFLNNEDEAYDAFLDGAHAAVVPSGGDGRAGASIRAALRRAISEP